MEEADGLEALLRQSMKLGERQKRRSDSRREKGRQHKQSANQREREGGSNVRESGGIGTVYLWVASCSLAELSHRLHCQWPSNGLARWMDAKGRDTVLAQR